MRQVGDAKRKLDLMYQSSGIGARSVLHRYPDKWGPESLFILRNSGPNLM